MCTKTLDLNGGGGVSKRGPKLFFALSIILPRATSLRAPSFGGLGT